MKKLLPLLLFMFPFSLGANMASPVWRGATPASAFTARYVDILHEDILITPDKDFEYAVFEVTYSINVLENGRHVPLLFYSPGGNEQFDNFSIWIDGIPVETEYIPENIKDKKALHYNELIAIYNGGPWKEDNRDTWYLGEFDRGANISFAELKYFHASLSKGKHTIKVVYKARQWAYFYEQVNAYAFHYALAPAKFWKSFGSLTVTIDASNAPKGLTTNLGKPFAGSLNSEASWHFDALPGDFITIDYKPTISAYAQNLLDIGVLPITLCITALFIALHIYITYRWRWHRPFVKFSWPALAGSILLPFVITTAYSYTAEYINHVIDPHANYRHQNYMFIITLPLLALLYYGLLFLLDLAVAKKIRLKLKKP